MTNRLAANGFTLTKGNVLLERRLDSLLIWIQSAQTRSALSAPACHLRKSARNSVAESRSMRPLRLSSLNASKWLWNITPMICCVIFAMSYACLMLGLSHDVSVRPCVETALIKLSKTVTTTKRFTISNRPTAHHKCCGGSGPFITQSQVQDKTSRWSAGPRHSHLTSAFLPAITHVGSAPGLCAAWAYTSRDHLSRKI